MGPAGRTLPSPDHGFARRTPHDERSSQPRWPLGGSCAGVLSTGASAALAAPTVTGGLLRGAHALSRLAAPSPLLAGLLGPGGLAGAVAGAVLLGSLLWTQRPRAALEGKAPWRSFAPPFALLGVALSPMLSMPAWPLAVASLACATLLGAAMIPRLAGARAPAALVAAACIAAVTLGALAAACGTGVAPAVVLAHSLYMASTQAILLAASLGAYRLASRGASTAYCERFLLSGKALSDFRLDGIGVSEPTVFQVPRRMREWVSAHRVGELTRQVQSIVLTGPGGCGKTVLAKGLAQALGGVLVAPTDAELGADCIGSLSLGSLNLTSVLVEAYARVRRSGTPLVVLLDEAEGCWGSAPRAGGLERGMHAYVAEQQRLLAHVARVEGVPLLFVATTNHPGRVEPPMDAYFVTQSALSREALQAILQQGLGQLRKVLDRLRLGGVELPKDALVDNVASQLHHAGLTGRDAQAYLTGLQISLTGQANHRGCLPRAETALCSEQVLKRILTSGRQVQAEPHPTERLRLAPPLHLARLTLQDGAQALMQLATFNLASSFADPVQSARIQAVVDRFYNSSALLAVWMAEALPHCPS